MRANYLCLLVLVPATLQVIPHTCAFHVDTALHVVPPYIQDAHSAIKAFSSTAHKVFDSMDQLQPTGSGTSFIDDKRLVLLSTIAIMAQNTMMVELTITSWVPLLAFTLQR